MDLNSYKEAAARTCPHLTKLPDEDTLDNLHMVLGMLTEVAELADVFKKNLAYGKPIDWVNVKEEIGDQFWYLVNFARVNGIDLEEQLGVNISKLMARYPEKFCKIAAVNRDLEKERAILEQKDLSAWGDNLDRGL